MDSFQNVPSWYRPRYVTHSPPLQMTGLTVAINRPSQILLHHVISADYFAWYVFIFR